MNVKIYTQVFLMIKSAFDVAYRNMLLHKIISSGASGKLYYYILQLIRSIL